MDFLRKYWKWLLGILSALGSGFLALFWALLRQREKTREAELKAVENFHAPKIESLREEHRKLTERLGAETNEVHAAEAKVVEAETELAKKFETKGLDAETIAGRLRAIGRKG